MESLAKRQTLMQLLSWKEGNSHSRSSHSCSSSHFELCDQLGVAHDIFLEKFSGQKICRQCGLVLETHIAVAELNGTHQEFNKDTRKVCKYQDIAQDLRRALRRPNLTSWSEIKEKQGLVEITRFSAGADVCPSVSRRAQNLYCHAIRSPEFIKKKILLITRVCIFHALRENQFPITLDEILKETNFQIALALKYYSILLRVCNLPKFSLSPTDFIPMIVDKLALAQNVVQKATEIILKYQKFYFASVTARSVAAGAIFLACRVMHHPCNRSRICSVLNLSHCTLRTRLKQMARLII